MASQAMKLSILIGADASGAKAGGAEAQAAMASVTTAANDAGAAINRLIGEQAGLNRAFASTNLRGDDIAAYGAQLDALRARFNPAYAAISRYRSEVTAIRDAHRVGAISSTEMTAALSRERQATLASIDAIKGRNTALRSMPVANNNVGAFQTANIAAQFQDVAVTAAMGMSPLQIALQQGTQLSAVLGPMGAAGAVRGLGAAFMSLISPVSLVTIGAIALGAAAIQYFTSSTSDAERLDDILARHAENIRDVKDAYGDAAAGLKEYVAESQTVLLANLAANQADARAAVLDAANDAYADITGRSQSEFAGPIDSYNAFAVATENLQKSIAAGAPDILAYRNAISAIAIDPDASESQQKLALELRDIDEEAIKIARALPKVAEAIATLQGASQRGFLVSDEGQRQAAMASLTDEYLRQKAAIDEVYKAGVTSRGALVTNAEELLKLEQALTEEYNKQRTAITSRGFRVTDKQSIIAMENGLTEAYLRQQDVLRTLRDNQAAFEAQRLQAAARSPEDKAAAARAAAAAQVITNEDPSVRAQRIDLAGKVAQANAERELQRAQEERARSLQASVAAQEFELSIVGKTAEEQARLRMEYQLTAQVKDQAARTGTVVDSQELELIRQKSAEYAKLASAISGQNALKSQTDDIDRLRLEISLVGQSAEVRARSMAAYEAEKQIRDAGIQSLSREAEAIRANAQTRAELQLQLERQQAAYQSVQQAGSTMIDQLTVGTGSLKDRLKAMAETLLTTFQQLAIANPLKNMLLGTNLPTFSDLISGKTASPIGATTTTGMMTVSAGTVMINGVPLTGLTSTLTAANQNIVNGVRPTLTPSGVINSPVAANQNIVNGVRPDLIGAGLINSPVAARTPAPTDIEAYIRQSALARGINPDTAVAVARSEGGLQSWNMQSKVPIGNGRFENSWGPFQLYKDGGLGNKMMTETGLDPAQAVNGPAGVDFALDYASKNGWSSWYGARNTGISKWEGIGKNPGVDSTTTNSISQTTNQLQKLGQTSNQVTGQIDTFGNGALDASKALTSGSQSITGSVNQLATTTAQVPAQSQGLFSSLFSSLGQGVQGVGSGIGGIFSSIFGGLFAHGAAFSGGNVVAFATGGVVSKPTLFPMAGGRSGVMGEAGPEAIMPLARGAGGRLGVAMVMPKQMRQSPGEFRMTFNNESTVVVTGTGDRELMERHRAAQEEANEIAFRRVEQAFPTWMEDYRRNPWARMSG